MRIEELDNSYIHIVNYKIQLVVFLKEEKL